MPNWYHGFARHNGYGPPPQFPGASPSPGIVHYLSGHSMHAQRCSQRETEISLTCEPGACCHFVHLWHEQATSALRRSRSLNTKADLPPPKERFDRIRRVPEGPRRNHLLSLRLQVSTKPLDLHTCYTPWPVFRDVTDGVGENTALDKHSDGVHEEMWFGRLV